MSGSGKFKNQQELKNKAMLVVRNITKQEVTNVIFPNGITVGLDGVNFKNGFKVNGNAQIGGVVNAQDFRINGGPLPTGDPSIPFLSVEVDSNVFYYGSDNIYESATQSARAITPSVIQARIIQLNQTASLTQDRVYVADARGEIPLTSSFNTVTLASGSTVTTFNIEPLSASYRTTYPITVSASMEGLVDQKKIFENTIPTLVQGPSIPHGDTGIAAASLTAGDIYMSAHGLIPASPPFSGFVTEAAQLNSGFMDFSVLHSSGHSGLPGNFTAGSSRPGVMFYKSPIPSASNVMVHNLKGKLHFKASSFSTGPVVELIPVLYKASYDAVRNEYKEFTLVAQYGKIAFSRANPEQNVILGNSSSTSITVPSQLTEGQGLAFGLYVNGVTGSPSAGTLSLSGSLTLEYAQV